MEAIPNGTIYKLVAALDISKSYIGIAISSMSGTFCEPLFHKCIRTHQIKLLQKIYNKYQPSLTVIGISQHCDEYLTASGIFVKHFVHKHRELLKPFVYINEHGTTALAQDLPYNVNVGAAIIILNKWKNLIK